MIEDPPLVLEAMKDYELLRSEPGQYKAKVDRMSDMFHLDGTARFKNDYHATYFVGDYSDGKPKDVLFGLNPGFDPKRDYHYGVGTFRDWNEFLAFERNFFLMYKTRSVRYYSYLSRLISSMNGYHPSTSKEIWEFLQANLVTVELIPYHSKRFVTQTKPDDRLIGHLQERIERNFAFAQTIRARSAIFNGRIYSILMKQNLGPPRVVIKKLNVHFFRFHGIPCILFDKFVPSAAAGVSYSTLEKIGAQFSVWVKSTQHASR